MNPLMKKRKKTTKATNEEKTSQTAETEVRTEDESALEAGEISPPEGNSDAVEEPEEKGTASGGLAEFEEQLLRLRAEYANYRRRTEKEKSEIAAIVKAEIYRGIIPVIDDFERFFQHVTEAGKTLDKEFVKGIEMIRSSLVGSLVKQGIKAVDTTGVPFDPHFHEAVLTEPVEKKKDDHTVRQVLETGYHLGELVIRPAKVKVGIYE
jgi:molecular chaperone GrpE